MKKKFNDTGLCVLNKHYMVDTTPQLKETIDLIEEGEYFIINRPRQFGKTTTLALLENTALLDDYIVISMGFEGIGDTCFDNEPSFVGMFIRKIERELAFLKIDISSELLNYNEKSTLEDLSITITNFINAMNKRVIVLIDEVDKSSNNQLFLSFLGLLRDKYLMAGRGRDATFHSVVLAGLHDVKNLKLKLRPDEEETYNSPWNIAISYDVDMTFSAKQIETMLVDYCNAKRSDNKSDSSPQMDISYIAKKLYYHTSGYPYFVSKLCKIIDEKIKPEKWSELDIIEAIKILLKEEGNPNFDKVIKILAENKEFFNFTERILLGKEIVAYTARSANMNFGKMHGVFRSNSENHVAVFNKIYDEMITDYMIATRIENGVKGNIIQADYLKENGKLDLKILLTKFKDAVKEKYSSAKSLKDKEFLEDDLRMLFFMYLKPILNGIGFCCKEVQTCEERRMDVVIFFRGEKFIIELKIWRGPKQHKAGLKQLKEYMDYENVEKGYMLIMNKNKTKEYKTTDEDGIFTAWV